jgi:hypothetical protein
MNFMKNTLLKLIISGTLLIAATVPDIAYSQLPTNTIDIYSGHFSRNGNNESPSHTINNSIYIKFFKGQWIATLYLPYPYAATVDPAIITKVLEEAKKQTIGSAYLRGKFGHLTEMATVHIEHFGYLEDRLIFECGSLAPCTIRLVDDFLELIKPGVITEHIIKYNHVFDQ